MLPTNSRRRLSTSGPLPSHTVKSNILAPYATFRESGGNSAAVAMVSGRCFFGFAVSAAVGARGTSSPNG